MSIRLKKVKWRKHAEGLGYYAEIMGVTYVAWRCNDGEFYAIPSGMVKAKGKLPVVKAACEQHALERIREAVEEYTAEERKSNGTN